KRCSSTLESEANSSDVKSLGDVLESSDNCLNFSDNIFRTALTDDKAIDILLDELIARDIRRIIIINETDSLYSVLYKRNILSKSVVDVINIDENNECSIKNLNFKDAQCFKLIETQNPDAILLIPSTKNNIWVEKVIEFNRNLDDPNGENRYLLLGADSMYQAGFIRVNGKTRAETEGMLIPLSWHRKSEPCQSDSSRLECRAVDILYSVKKTNNDGSFNSAGINWRTAMAYDAAQILFKASAEAKDQCFIQKHFGLRARCIRGKLKGILAKTKFGISDGEETSGQLVQFEDGDRERSNEIIVEAKAGNFRLLQNSL
ncbi:MAG: ABC transporter substrate-binding protein, partial [Cyanobacteria bacterium J06649_11]